MLTKALTSFSDRLPKYGKRKTFETVSTQELCKYLVCIKQCCWQGGQIFSCWLLLTFDPNSPPRIPEHTTSKSNSMTTDYFLINLMMNHTNNKYTKKCRHDTLRLWTQLIDKSVKLSRRRKRVKPILANSKLWQPRPVLDCTQCTENSLVISECKKARRWKCQIQNEW